MYDQVNAVMKEQAVVISQYFLFKRMGLPALFLRKRNQVVEMFGPHHNTCNTLINSMFGQDQRTLFFLLVYDKENYNLYVSVKPISNHKLRDGERKSSLSIYCVVVIYSFQNTIHHYDFILILIPHPVPLSWSLYPKSCPLKLELG